MSTRNTSGFLWRAAAVSVLTACAATAQAEFIRTHGRDIDAQHQVILFQDYNLIQVALWSYERRDAVEAQQEGHFFDPRGRDTGRSEELEYLLEVKIDIIKSSAPNPFQNPGEAYRVTFNSLELTPEYHSVVLAPASKVRDVVIGEFSRFWVREDDVYKDALVKSAPLLLKVFQDTDLLPAEITESVLRSRTGRFRITPEARQRRPVRAPQVFAPEIETGRPVAGATVRAREKEELLRGAASFQEVRGVGLVPVQARPRTPAAAAAAEGVEAAQRAATARTGSPERGVTWTGPGVGLYAPWINVSQGIGHYAP